MGFKSSEWAYSVVNLTAPERAVLVALAHCRNDKTGACFPGQERLVTMTGLSEKTVRRALSSLESGDSPVIAREMRFAGRYRTSDSYSLLFDDYRSERPPVTLTTGQDDQWSESPSLPVTESFTTGHSDHPIEEEHEVEQEGEQEDSSSPSARDIDSAFNQAYAIWPKKVEKKASLQAFAKATKKRSIDQLVADIIRFGNAYAATREKQYIPALPVWLRGERWDDELPAQGMPTDLEWNTFLTHDSPSQSSRVLPGRDSRRPLTRTEQNLLFVAELAELDNAENCAAGKHRWLPNHTCNFCAAQQEQHQIDAA